MLLGGAGNRAHVPYCLGSLFLAPSKPRFSLKSVAGSASDFGFTVIDVAQAGRTTTWT